MEKIDKTSDQISAIVKDSNEAPDSIILGVLIDKINEIIDEINKRG